VYHQYVVLLGQGDHALEEVQFHALGGGVGGKAENHHLWFGDRTANGPLQFGEEVHTRHQRHRTHLRTGNHRTVDVNRVARVGHQHRVALIQGRQHQVRQAFLGADGDNGLALGVDLDLVAFLVPVGNRPAQARNTLGRRVTVGVLTLGDGDEFFDDVRRGRAVGVTHAQVDDVFATTTGGHLQLGGDVENVRGESIYARKAARRTLFGHCCLDNVSARNRPSDAGHCGDLGRNVRAAVTDCPARM